MRRALGGLGLLLALAVAVLGGWAMLPEASADPRAAFGALRNAADAHGFVISGVEPAPHRAVPGGVAFHPRRLLRRLQAGRDHRLASPGEGASRYTLTDADSGIEISCEMQQREGAVVWVWLDGPAEEARRIKDVRGLLRAAMPWVPVSCPWQ